MCVSVCVSVIVCLFISLHDLSCSSHLVVHSTKCQCINLMSKYSNWTLFGFWCCVHWTFCCEAAHVLTSQNLLYQLHYSLNFVGSLWCISSHRSEIRFIAYLLGNCQTLCYSRLFVYLCLLMFDTFVWCSASWN